MEFIQTAAIIVLLILAFITDIKAQIIPNQLTISFFIAAFIYQIATNGLEGAAAAALGAAAGFVPLLLLHLAKGIGAGDVKLFGALGAWAGVLPVLQLLLYAILYAGVIGLILILVNRPFGKRVTNGVASFLTPDAGQRRHQWLQWAESGKKFPFMLAVAPAAVTVWSVFN
ncbi:A24 family peptidase [Paenibacillus sp. LHD-38]|uniref:A24 family peptidase n=1 Tax=Paenibacillus sp. LHD-38 TaxID=3072143 RepID=UPI00280FE8C1|nr:A24 family peptidase [Paenibacillus sp. LHD-38]MDQ8736010.1 A24 family peptidase [Paenibacillus sp. LHD-38]